MLLSRRISEWVHLPNRFTASNANAWDCMRVRRHIWKPERQVYSHRVSGARQLAHLLLGQPAPFVRITATKSRCGARGLDGARVQIARGGFIAQSLLRLAEIVESFGIV